jgi:AAA+ superfamily predicted ATPase
MVQARDDLGRCVFLLHFNVDDLVFAQNLAPDFPNDLWTVSEYIAYRLAKAKSLALSYSLHDGLRVHTREDLESGSAAPRPTNTWESNNSPSQLWQDTADHAASQPYALIRAQASPGRSGHDDPKTPHEWRHPDNVFPLFSRVLLHDYHVKVNTNGSGTSGSEQTEKNMSVGVLIEHLQHLVPAPNGPLAAHNSAAIMEALHNWSSDPYLALRKHVVVCITPDLAALHAEVQGGNSRLSIHRLPMPGRDDRKAFVAWLVGFDEYRLPADADDANETEAIDKLANGSAGMNLRELRDFVRFVNLHPDADWRTRLAERRAEIVSRESDGLLRPQEPKHGLADIAGYDYVKEQFDRLLPRLREGRADIAGILFVGPPGTGKSYFAAALARDAGVPMFVMRNVRSMWVGESERNFERILEVARTLAPAVIFVDEIDQAFMSRSSNRSDSGVEQRLLGRLLEFMEDKGNLGRVLWIAASNRPDLLDAALLSRFKLRIPFLLPDEAACRDLLENKLPAQAGFRWQTSIWNEWMTKSVVGHYSGRELETMVRAAFWRAEDDAHHLTSAGNGAWREQRSAQLAVLGLELPPRPIEQRGSNGMTMPYADPVYLQEILHTSNPGHDEREYVRQSLLALLGAPFSTPALARAVRTSLPDAIGKAVVSDDNRINTQEIAAFLDAQTNFSRKQSAGS